jgi:outer membrane protein assembly factor BamD
MTRFFRPLTAALLVVLLLSACSSGRLRYDSPQDAYNKGLEAYERGRYTTAAEYFQAVLSFGRAGEYADDAQLYLARSYGASEQYILAASEYSRFSELYRSDPRVAEAEFERAQMYVRQSPGYQLDQTQTQAAVTSLQLFVNRFPDHEKRADAEELIADLRAKMARKAFESGTLYERRELFEAAAITYERAFQDYPDAAYADESLLGAIRMYVAFAEESIAARQPERYGKAIELYERFVEIFPTSEHLRDAEDYYTRAARALPATAAN